MAKAKIVQLKTPLELQNYLWLNGGLVSLAGHAELLANQRKRELQNSVVIAFSIVPFAEIENFSRGYDE